MKEGYWPKHKLLPLCSLFSFLGENSQKHLQVFFILYLNVSLQKTKRQWAPFLFSNSALLAPHPPLIQVPHFIYCVSFQDSFCKFSLMSWSQILHHILDAATEPRTRYSWAELFLGVILTWTQGIAARIESELIQRSYGRKYWGQKRSHLGWTSDSMGAMFLSFTAGTLLAPMPGPKGIT